MDLEARNGRRQFLTTTLGAGLFALLQPCRAWAALGAPRQENALGARLVELLSHKASARIIGLAYLRSTTREADTQTLAEILATDLARDQVDLHNTDIARLRGYLQRRTQHDFEAGRIVRLQGWMLAVTEARLCALVALT